MWLLRKKTFWGAGLAGTLLIVGVVVAIMAAEGAGTQPGSGAAEGAGPSQAEDGDLGAISVKTIRPKCDPSFTLSVREPATVAAYYLSELDAQVAGKIEFIRKAEGAPVKKGELLAKIAVPDLDQEVALKEAVIKQRQEELEVARKSVKIAEAGKVVAENDIEVQKASVEVAKAMEIYKGKQYRRFKELAHLPVPGALGQVEDEAEKDHLAALADLKRANNAVIKAESALVEARAKLDAANADVKLKAALIGVAEKDRQKAKAMADYSEIRSEFHGNVKRRFVDPGSFLRIGEPVMAVERTDIVTVTMKVPDTFAPYVNENTDAFIEMSELPGQLIHGKVTRFSPSLQTKANDRTMLVAVDLYNGSEDQYTIFLNQERAKKVPYDDLKEGPMPICPKVAGVKVAAEPHRLRSGMYGEMRLVFRKLPNVFLIPSDAIDRAGGTPSLFLVKDGKAVRVEAIVEVDDQNMAMVKIIERSTAGEQVKRPLTGTEEIVYSNFNELTDGQTVNTIPVDWTPRD
jgi:multidrug efflux pump subunit AcrA (membrane-fusion protein)